MPLIAEESTAAIGGSMPSGIGAVCRGGHDRVLRERAVRRGDPPNPTRVPSGRRPMPSKHGIAGSAAWNVCGRVVRAGDDRPVDVLDRDRLDGHQHLTFRDFGVRKILIARNASCAVYDCCLHAHLPLLQC